MKITFALSAIIAMAATAVSAVPANAGIRYKHFQYIYFRIRRKPISSKRENKTKRNPLIRQLTIVVSCS
jgi:hypothetical protein